VSLKLITVCFPWFAILAIALVTVRLLISICGAKLRWRRFGSLNHCEQGSVQSLSFVLTLPFFLLIIMLIVQVSQIMVANVVVHYAAFASVRSASVWVPSSVDLRESANRISAFSVIEQTDEGTRYRINPNQYSFKFLKIQDAAIQACASLAPSRNLGYGQDLHTQLTSLAWANLYAGLDAESVSNTRIADRLRNKLAYSSENTELRITFWHRVGPFDDYQDPPLQIEYLVGPYLDEFQGNELGWQDEISTSVTHRLALLPGPIRLFSRLVQPDALVTRYTYPVSATATMVIEGEKPLLPYWQEEVR